ncbi:MAG: hypothetical protein GC160_15035 [Acidobacteria bacterium]|nr:hypothetical protein [Acidobacteriota bacterium]
MKCRELDVLLCEYLDDALDAEQRREVEEHLLGCPDCREARDEADFALSALRSAPLVEPPPQLIADIIHDTIGVGAGALAPAGGGLLGFLRPIFNPFLEPRFVMGMAMTVVSFSMLTYHGQRAFESWQQPHEPSPVIEMAETAGVQAEGAWRRVADMVAAARDFYELQTGSGGLEPGSPEAAPQEDR